MKEGITRPHRALRILAVLVAAAWQQPAGAADFTWNTNAATAWETNGAWTFSGIDANGDSFPSGTDVIVGITDLTTAGTVRLNGAYTIGGLTHSTNVGWTFQARGNSTLTVNGDAAVIGSTVGSELIFDANGFDFDLNITGDIIGGAFNNPRFRFGTAASPLGDLVIGDVMNPRGRTLINATGTVSIGSFGAFSSPTAVFLANTDEHNANRIVSTDGLDLKRGVIYAGGLTGAGSGSGTNVNVNLVLTGSGDYSMDNAAARLLDNPATNSPVSRLSLTMTGSGTQTLAGTYLYTGDTTVNNGLLLLNGDGAMLNGTTFVNGGTYGGTGTNGGAIQVNSGGILAPGASIESLHAGALAMNNGSTFAFEIDSSDLTPSGLAAAADLLVANGNLTFGGTVTLTIDDIAGTDQPFAVGTAFSLINYAGLWNGSNLTFSGNELIDGEIFTAGLNTWQIDYGALNGGLNLPADQITGSFVNLTIIPEPSTVALAALGFLLGAALRRRPTA